MAFAASGAAADVRREELGPRWTIGKCCDRVNRIEYDVDVARMEREIFEASDSFQDPRRVCGPVGLLRLRIHRPKREPFHPIGSFRSPGMADFFPRWSRASRQAPSALTARAPDYYALADSQIMMGPKLQVRKIDGNVPLFVAAYAEGEAGPGSGRRARARGPRQGSRVFR